MKVVYPVILEKLEGDKKDTYLVYVPDFKSPTEGYGLADALYMAQDMISILSIVYQDEGNELPRPTPLDEVEIKDGQFKSLVWADLKAYRKKYEKRSVKKTLTLPGWINAKAEAAHINFSETLANALLEKFDELEDAEERELELELEQKRKHAPVRKKAVAGAAA